MSAPAARPSDPAKAPSGFWRRTGAMLIKEFIQLRRDRVSFAMIVMIPLMQLMLFGYAINTTPRNLPTAVLLQERSDLGRSILKAHAEHAIFQGHASGRMTRTNSTDCSRPGKVLFGVEIPRGFERALRRGEKPALLVAADATDPVASGSALGALQQIVRTALQNERAVAETVEAAVRDPHPCPLQSGRRDLAQYRAGTGRHHPRP